MSEEILDRFEKDHQQMPVTVWQAGLRGAIGSCLVSGVVFIMTIYISYGAGISDKTQQILSVILVLVPTIVAIIWYARKGKNRHRLQYSLTVAYISILPPALLAYSLIVPLLIGDQWYDAIGLLIPLMIILLIAFTIVSVLAIFIWLTFGKIE